MSAKSLKRFKLGRNDRSSIPKVTICEKLFVGLCVNRLELLFHYSCTSHTHLFFMYDNIYVNFSTVDNNDMKSSKRHAVFLSLIFLLKMYIKTNEILAFIATVKKVSFLHVESSSISCFVKFADFYRNVLLYLIPSLIQQVSENLKLVISSKCLF